MIRRLLPASIAALVALSFLRWEGQQLGMYGTTAGIALLTVAAVGVVGGLLWHFARSLDRDDQVRREAEAELRHSSRYFEVSRDLACTAGLDGIFRRLNPAWTDTLGWTEDELRSRPFVEFVHPDDRESTENESAGLAQGGVTVNFCNRYATKDGGWRWFEWRAVANLEEELIYASARDVTEGKATEAALETSERQTRQILETASDAFISIDARGLITGWNPQAEVTFGWSLSEALGRDLSETIVPEPHREAHRRGIERFLTTEKGTVMGRILSLPALHRDGHEFPIELTVAPLRTVDGWSFNAFVRDVTEREAARELLEQQRRQLVDAQSVGQFGSWEWNIAADTLDWSDEFHRLLGRAPGESTTFDSFLECVHPDDRAGAQAEIQAAIETGEPFSFEHRIVQPGGDVRVNYSRGEVIMGEDGVPLRVLGTGQDITERHEIERAKDEFASVVSHELRTPLTSIRGSLGLLESGVLGALPEKSKRMVEIAVENTDRLVRLVNDILDIERIDSGTIDMQKEPCDAGELIARATETLQPLAAEAQVTLRADAPSTQVVADPDRILQTLTNLVSNAVKFSAAQSTVEILCARRGGEVLFAVTDQGRGIPASKLDSIFERFQQVDASDSRDKGGTGLGLAICRTIVQNHGGRIWVESVVGEGSTFSFTLPALAERERAKGDRSGSDERTALDGDDDASVGENGRSERDNAPEAHPVG